MATATDGSHGFKISIRKLTIALFVLGGLIAAIAIYQQFLIEAKPYAISHQDAVRIALVQVDKEPNRDEVFLPNEKAMARLVHVTDNGMGFVADEDSLVDMWLYSKENRFLSIYENMYLWEVQVSTTDNEGGGRGYSYVIDATTGQVIGDDRDYSYFESS